MFEKLKHLKDLRGQAKQLQNAMAEKTVEATAAHGQIKVVMDGNMTVTDINIDPTLLTPDKQTVLINGLKEATNDCYKKAQRVMADYMRSSGQFNIPGITS